MTDNKVPYNYIEQYKIVVKKHTYGPFHMKRGLLQAIQ